MNEIPRKKKKTISKDQIFHKEEDKLHISL